MSEGTAGDFEIDLTDFDGWDGIVPPELIAEQRAMDEAEWDAQDAARAEAERADRDDDDDESRLPQDFEQWTTDQREAWAYDTDLPRFESRERRRLYGAYLTLHPEHDILRQRDGGKPAAEPSVFVDIAAILDGGVTAPQPDGGPTRADGARLFYRGKVNALIGDPESAKTLLALVVLADAIAAAEPAVFIDTDHNGPEFILRFLQALGVPRDALVERLHYANPDDRAELVRAIDAAADLPAGSVVLDSVGENLSLWGVSPNDDQGFIDLNRATAARLAKAGHLVLTIDHFAKNTESRKFGATGSTAKLRAADGAVYETRVASEFSPATGGKTALVLRKDRTGGVRSLGYQKNDPVAVFEITAPDTSGLQGWTLHPGSPGPASGSSTAQSAAARLAADVIALGSLTPPPTSQRNVQARMQWGAKRSLDALRAWRAQKPGGTS